MLNRNKKKLSLIFILSVIILTDLLLCWLIISQALESNDVESVPTLSPTIDVSLTPAPSVNITPTKNVTPVACSNECTDCSLFPVNKINSLRSDYSPNATAINLNGGGNLVTEAATALGNLFELAEEQNIKLKVVSTYRSYQTQQSLFESYVQLEMNKGNLGREEATRIANIYSAKAGHSEHQLGTTADISCVGCTAFADDANNLAVYEFLKLNTNEFGFVVSYTEQNKHITAYKAEPWHIRYIGVDLANEYSAKYNELEGNYSQDIFLQEKCKM